MDKFKVLAIMAGHERPVFSSPDKKVTCEFSMMKNKKTCGTVYIVELPDKSRMTIEDQREYLAAFEECKHMRTHGQKINGGFKYKCLRPLCGHEWFVQDKPLNEEDLADKARFEHMQELEDSRRR